MSNNSPPNLLQASVGKKMIMAVSGIFVIGFVIVHLIGNLQLFIGQEQLNKYAEALQSMGALKWCFRIFILAFFGFHVWKGIVLWLENKKARPVAYAKDETLEASLSSRTMIWTGALIFSFVVYHLLHYTMIITNPEYAVLPLVDGRFDVYTMVILGFKNYLISGIYIIAIILMSFHLSHSISSLFQTLGLNNPSMLPRLKWFSNLAAIIIFCGYVSMPIAVLLNLIKLPGGSN